MQKGKDLYPEIHEIRRTDRKTIAIQITEEGKVIVKAPLNASDEAIMRVGGSLSSEGGQKGVC